MALPDAGWWENLVQSLRIAEKRRAGVQDLYQVMGSRVCHYLEGKGLQPADARDLTQDIFIKVIRHLDDFRGDAKGFPAWVWAITRNTLKDAQRLRKPMQSISDPDDPETPTLEADPEQGPEQIIERDSLADCVRRGFRRFLEQYPDRAQCLAWLATDSLDIPAIADQLGRTLGATREYLSQCRKKLKPFLEPCYEAQS